MLLRVNSLNKTEKIKYFDILNIIMVAIFKMDVIEKLIPDKIGEITILKIDGKHFIFDKESLKEYNEYFKNDFFIIFLENGYLCRRPKWDKDAKPKNFQFFHRFLMEKELSEKGEDSHIHHLTWCKRINIKKYLIIIPAKEHTIMHSYGLYDTKFMQQSKWIEFDN